MSTPTLFTDLGADFTLCCRTCLG